MAYDYIAKRYGIRFKIGERVRHTETGRFGKVVRLPAGRGAHHVSVLFDGDRFSLPCHPHAVEMNPAERLAS